MPTGLVRRPGICPTPQPHPNKHNGQTPRLGHSPTWQIHNTTDYTGTNVKADTAFTYSPQGQCIGTMPATHLALLHQLYHKTKQSSPPWWSEHTTGTFENDIASLLTRYKGTAVAPPPKQLKPHLLAALTHLDITHDRLSNPIQFSNMQSTYSSVHPADQLFGATQGPYNTPWTGGSVLHSITDPKDIDKALRWALTSAQAAEEHAPTIPTCTVLVLPNKPNAHYNTYLKHPWTHQLARIPRGTTPYEDTPTWTGGKLNSQPTWKQGYTILAVTNPAGLQHISTCTTFERAWKAASHALPNAGKDCLFSTPHQPPNTHAQQHTTQTATFPHPPRALRSLLHNHPVLPNLQPQPTVRTTVATCPTYPCTYKTLPKIGRQLYTDGSEIPVGEGPNLLGAAVYCPKDGESYHINPGGIGCTRTNNRAELSAIHMALAHTNQELPVTIYTDSLASLCAIRKHLYTPHLTQTHKHKGLLEEICSHLRRRVELNTPTYLHKVRSHTGIRGNDEADRMAKEAATFPSRVLPRNHDHAGENAYADVHWPSVQTSQDSPGDPPLRRLVTDLAADIKRNLPRNTHLGGTGPPGTYSAIWEKTTHQIIGDSSNRFWKDASLPWWQKVQIHKARWGRLWTRKLAWRFKIPYAGEQAAPTSATCPIYKMAQDGANHILAGCSQAI